MTMLPVLSVCFLYYLSVAVVTNYHKPSGLKPQISYSFGSQKSKVDLIEQNCSICRTVFNPGGSSRQSVFLFLLEAACLSWL